MLLSEGNKLGHYQILGPLGAGGMGEVYRAHDTQLDRDVAIKVLPHALATDPERLALQSVRSGQNSRPTVHLAEGRAPSPKVETLT